MPSWWGGAGSTATPQPTGRAAREQTELGPAAETEHAEEQAQRVAKERTVKEQAELELASAAAADKAAGARMQTPQVLQGVVGAGALDRDRGSPQRLQSVVGADALGQARVELEQKCDLCGASSADDTKLTNFWWRGYSRCQQCQSSGEGAEMTASPHSAVSEAPKQARRAA